MDFQLELVHLFILQAAHLLIAVGKMLLDKYGEKKNADRDG